MDGHGAWDGFGTAMPLSHDLEGMSLFDSPLSELYEVGPGEDIDLCADLELDFFQGDIASMPFDYTQGSFPPASCSDSVGAFDMTTEELAACFNFNDPQLYPDFDGMDLELELDLDLAASSHAFSSVDASPFSRLSNASAMTAATSPASPHDGAAHPFRCTTDDCTKTFRKESQLKQHQRVHKKSLICPICRSEHQTEHKFAQVRDLERHLQARHPDVAKRANVRSETRECPHPGCEHRGRRDNVSRHFESKHGGKLKWRKGVPSVV